MAMGERNSPPDPMPNAFGAIPPIMAMVVMLIDARASDRRR
jgi:hypothetical protein